MYRCMYATFITLYNTTIYFRPSDLHKVTPEGHIGLGHSGIMDLSTVWLVFFLYEIKYTCIYQLR